MIERIPYRPVFDSAQMQAFDERLRHVPGSRTMTRSFLHAGDLRLIRLHWIISGERWCNERGYFDFLDQRSHRVLLRCFLRHLPVTTEQVLQKTGKTMDLLHLQQALRFLEMQELTFRYRENEWICGPSLASIENIGSTFEWMVQAYLQHGHQALARRCASFKEWEVQRLNDLDVLAFTGEHVLIVECKSSTDILPEQITRFIQRATLFPADIALLLIDTENTQPVIKCLRQMHVLTGHESTGSEHMVTSQGSTIAQLNDTVYVANTAGGVMAALDAVLRMKQQMSDPLLH